MKDFLRYLLHEGRGDLILLLSVVGLGVAIVAGAMMMWR